MTTSHTSTRIHPLVAMAAVSVTIVSALGIAAITGVLPTSRGADAGPLRAPTELSSEAKQFVPSGSSGPIQQASTQRPINTQKPSVAATTQRPVTQVSSHEAAPPAKPAPQNSPLGIGVGAVIGGVLGNQIGSGDGKTLATIAGAIGGGYIGNEVAKKNQ